MKLSRALSFAILLVVVWLIYAPLLEIRPFENVNLYILAWLDRSHAVDLLRVDPSEYPEWRPLPYATLWLQYQWATIDHIWSYYALNIVIWTACAWLVSRIARALSNSEMAGFVAALIVLTSTPLVGSFVLIMERQSSLATLFGLSAWLVVVKLGDRRPTRYEWAGLFLLLIASALSKEYGLAFSAAIAVYFMRNRRWDLAAAGIAAAGIYGGLRLAFASGALAARCEDEGFFFQFRQICFDKVDPGTSAQAAYNVVATGLGSLLPGIFFDDGQISISPRWLMISILLLAIALLGWAKGNKLSRLGLLVVGFNTILNFMVYRSRNHMSALCAVAVAVGVGFPIAWAALRRTSPAPLARGMAVALLLSILAIRILVIRQLVAERVEMSSRPDACGPDIPALDRGFMERIWQKYNLQLPDCLAVDRR